MMVGLLAAGGRQPLKSLWTLHLQVPQKVLASTPNTEPQKALGGL